MLTHIDKKGNAKIVNISQKKINKRQAVACGRISVSKKTLQTIKNNTIKKGDVLTVAKIAGIMSAKNTSGIIPLCHPINIAFLINENKNFISAKALVTCKEKTGVEMEALTAVSICLLTIYDMCKAIDKEMIIENIHLIEKIGGKSDFKK